MQIKATRSVEQSIIRTDLTIDSFGSGTLTPEEEMEMLNDFKLELNTASVLFSRPVIINDHKNPEVVQDVESVNEYDVVTISIPFQTYHITEDMDISYSVDVRKLNNLLENYRYISDSICLAKAMICVFEDVIVAWIQEQLETAKQHKDNFESEHYYII